MEKARWMIKLGNFTLHRAPQQTFLARCCLIGATAFTHEEHGILETRCTNLWVDFGKKKKIHKLSTLFTGLISGVPLGCSS